MATAVLGQDDRRLLAESSLDFLIVEMVDLMHRSPSDTDTTETDKEAAYFKLETLGYQVGMALVERLTKDRPRFLDNLDVVKFICKDFWIALFKKQIDNLKTNHRGVYVLTDNNFRWFSRMSGDGANAEISRQAYAHLAFPCGLIRGALGNLGVSTVVIGEVSTVPQCTFQIKINKP
ncbi:Trafficking protein particle complex subunit 33 [Thoreauomyces humboldtii]|nr:Trafficking protein particle complex subunit 33 [Thoreauomyces humboldtii]